jgi:sugar lactone lactonase YvrE
MQFNNPNLKRKKYMKTITKFIYAVAFGLIPSVLGLLALAIGASSANASPGDLYESDDGSNNIYKFTPGGTQSTFASGLNGPLGLAFDSAGNLFEADAGGSGNIYEFTPGGTQSTFASGISAPFGLAFDSVGNLFAASLNTSTIYKFTPGGTRSTFASGGGLFEPFGLAFNSAGNLFVTDLAGAIFEFTPGGTRSVFAILTGPRGLAFDSAGNLFVTDVNGNIYEFTPGGTRSTFASGLNNPIGLAFDSAGNLFEADTNSGNIYEFTPGGTQSTFASGLNGPAFLAFEPTTYSAQVQQPINADGTSVFNVRRGVVPVKFTLTQGGVATCALPPATIALTRTAGGTTGAIDESVYIGPADTGSNFRIDSCQYVYNLSSSALGVGTYRVDIQINGQVVGSGIFQLK